MAPLPNFVPARRLSHALLLAMCALCALCVLCHAARADEDAAAGGAGGAAPDGNEPAEAEPLPDDATLRKMRVSQLKALLARKGADAACVACTSKAEYVDRIRETADWPDATAAPSPSPADPTEDELREMFSGGKDSADLEDIRRKLKEAGLGNTKLFTKDDLEKMDFRDIKSGEAGATDGATQPDGDVKVDL